MDHRALFMRPIVRRFEVRHIKDCFVLGSSGWDAFVFADACAISAHLCTCVAVRCGVSAKDMRQLMFVAEIVQRWSPGTLCLLLTACLSHVSNVAACEWLVNCDNCCGCKTLFAWTSNQAGSAPLQLRRTLRSCCGLVGALLAGYLRRGDQGHLLLHLGRLWYAHDVAKCASCAVRLYL